MEDVLRRYGQPETFNTDRGAQFTSEVFTGLLNSHRINIGMVGKGRWVDNVFIERLWRSLEYEEVYVKAYETPKDAEIQIGHYFQFYNSGRSNQTLNRLTPHEVYSGTTFKKAA